MTMRDAREDDYARYGELFVELGVPDPVPPRERFERELCGRSFVAERAGEIVGWGLIDALAGIGYVRNIIVDPGHRRRGIGRALMAEAAQRFRARGCARWCLNVKPDNEPAIALYRAMGMEVLRASVAIRIEWSSVAKVGDVVELAVRVPGDDELAGLERRFDLALGLLASTLAHGGRHVRVVEQEGEPVALACFDPSFPGCFPFAAASPAAARAALEAVAPCAKPDTPWLQLVVEDASPVACALEAAGGWRVLEMLYLEGALPD